MRQMKQFVILLSAVLAFSSCVHKVQKEQQEKSIVHTNPLPVQFGDPYVNRQDLSRNYPTNLCLIRAIRLSTGT